MYDPISSFWRDYFSTPQVSTEPAGDLMDSDWWGRHSITNREDRRSLGIPGVQEEYHPVPSPERRKPNLSKGDTSEGAMSAGEISPDTERRLLDEAGTQPAGTNPVGSSEVGT